MTYSTSVVDVPPIFCCPFMHSEFWETRINSAEASHINFIIMVWRGGGRMTADRGGVAVRTRCTEEGWCA